MAAKKGSTNTAVAERKNTAVGAPIDYEAEMLKHAQRGQKLVEAAGTSGAWLTFRGGILKFKGAELKDNKAETIVLDAMLENQFYEDAFDPDEPASPVCFAFGRELSEMKPHPTAPKPQNAKCDGCKHNAWGSGDKGRGKACKNIQRLAIIPYGDGSPEQLEAAEIALTKLPVTSVRNWANYVNGLMSKFSRPFIAFVTKIGAVPDAKSQFKVTFEHIEPIEKKLIPIVLQRAKEAESLIVPAEPYPPFEKEEKKPARGAKTSGKKKF